MCDQKGRDCIERNSVKTLNCSTNCAGIYADVQWVGLAVEEGVDDKDLKETDNSSNGRGEDKVPDKVLKRLAELEKRIESMEGAVGKKGEELDKEKYQLLIAEYRNFKSKNIKIKVFLFRSIKCIW